MSYYKEVQKNAKTIKKSLLERVQKEKPCWIWTGSVTAEGHGQIGLGFATFKAHRLSYMLYNGELAPGKRVIQSCGNKLCVNPKHQKILVTKKELRAQRGPLNVLGTNNGNAKLKPADIHKIRRLAKKKSATELAKKFNVTASQIRRILKGINWGHI